MVNLVNVVFPQSNPRGSKDRNAARISGRLHSKRQLCSSLIFKLAQVQKTKLSLFLVIRHFPNTLHELLCRIPVITSLRNS